MKVITVHCHQAYLAINSTSDYVKVQGKKGSVLLHIYSIFSLVLNESFIGLVASDSRT